jgi:poly(3-hydroxybutyrate) depolymerase
MRKTYLVAVLVALMLLLLPTSSQATGKLDTKTTTVQNKTRTYLVYVPETCANTSCPALFMFHGLNGTAQQAADNYGWKETADKNGFIAVFPESLTIPKKDVKIFGFNVYPNYDPAGKHWDIALITLPLSQRYTTQDVEFVSKMISELGIDYKILTNQVYATGHSYGAFFSYYVTQCLVGKIKAFAESSGGYVSYYGYAFPIPALNAKLNTSYKTPGILLHSQKDATVSYQWSVNLSKELASKGHSYKFVTLADSFGHDWDPAQNQVQWDFLKQYK